MNEMDALKAKKSQPELIKAKIARMVKVREEKLQALKFKPFNSWDDYNFKREGIIDSYNKTIKYLEKQI